MVGALAITALRGAGSKAVSLTVPAGGCAAITGPSGCGKSRFLRMVADLEPSAGDVRFGDIGRDRVAAPDWRRLVMFVGAEAGWWSERVGAHFPPETLKEAERLARCLALPTDCLERNVRTLSTGEKQRLALIRALVRRPPCLLLDEPTAALDRDSVSCVEDVLRDRCSVGLTLLIVTHEEAQIERLKAERYAFAQREVAPA